MKVCMTVQWPYEVDVMKKECWMATQTIGCKTKWVKECKGSKTDSYKPYKCRKIRKQVS